MIRPVEMIQRAWYKSHCNLRVLCLLKLKQVYFGLSSQLVFFVNVTIQNYILLPACQRPPGYSLAGGP